MAGSEWRWKQPSSLSLFQVTIENQWGDWITQIAQETKHLIDMMIWYINIIIVLMRKHWIKDVHLPSHDHNILYTIQQLFIKLYYYIIYIYIII